MASLVRLERLSKHYDTVAGSVPVLKDIDLEIAPGEFLAVMGPSGSGKSTLLNILGCLDTPSSGAYYLDGRDVAKLGADALAEVRGHLLGFVFQRFNLLGRVTALDNVALPLLYAGVAPAERRTRAQRALAQMGIAEFAHALPNQLSGGQQQRVAIARALVNHPRLILADEPTGNLDSQTGHEIMEVFAALNRSEGITLVLVTHEYDIAHFARRLVRVLDGRIVYDGEVKAA